MACLISISKLLKRLSYFTFHTCWVLISSELSNGRSEGHHCWTMPRASFGVNTALATCKLQNQHKDFVLCGWTMTYDLGSPLFKPYYWITRFGPLKPRTSSVASENLLPPIFSLSPQTSDIWRLLDSAGVMRLIVTVCWWHHSKKGSRAFIVLFQKCAFHLRCSAGLRASVAVVFWEAGEGREDLWN